MARTPPSPAVEHAWRYFEFHAAQRITVFNYYVALSGLLATGLAVILQADAGAWYLGIGAGALLSLFSFLFWKFDQRVSGMIKLSEAVLEKCEQSQLDGNGQIFCADLAANSRRAQSYFQLGKEWTYGRTFRAIFVVIGLAGLLGAGISAARALNCPRCLCPIDAVSAQTRANLAPITNPH